MKSLPYLILSVFALAAILSAGCNRIPVRVKVEVKDTRDLDPWRSFLDTVRYTDNTRAGDEWTLCRGGCDQLNKQFAKSDIQKGVREFTTKNRPFLETQVHLTPDELSEVESTSFRTADAHYLDECFMLQDTAKALDVPGQETADKAHVHFRWVMRNVLPHEQNDSWTPPAFTLRRGCGSPLERALVFLALLRQAQISGCLIVVPEAEPKQFLVAALEVNDKTSQLLLFDTRLGAALPGKDGKSVLTLHEALQDPALLKPAHITAEQVKKLEVWLVCPLYALSGRMNELQKRLGAHSAMALHLDAAELFGEMEKAAKLTVQVWNPPAKDKTLANSPTRCLRMFLPIREGGTDETNRALYANQARVPFQNVMVNLAQIRLTKQVLPVLGYGQLLRFTEDFFNKYDLQIREMHLRGMYDAIIRRQERLQLFAKSAALERLVGDQNFDKEVDDWREKMNAASAAAFLDDPKEKAKGQQAMQHLWGQDQFMRWMIEITKEEKLEHQHEMTVVTRVLAVGMRDHFDIELARSQAAVNHERADHLQALLQADKEPGNQAKIDVRDAWGVTRDAWENFYLKRIFLQSAIAQQLKQLKLVPFDPEYQFDQIDRRVALLESLHLDVQKYFQARFRLAECLQRVEGEKAARDSLHVTFGQIDSLEKAGQLLAEIKSLKEHPHAKAKLTYHQRLDLLARDWTEQGSYFWMKQQIELRAGLPPSKK